LLVTSEHKKANFLAAIQIITQGHIDNQALLANLSQMFDLDLAVGVQLDAVGRWIGPSRDLEEPLTGVYFSFDTPGLGLDQGQIFGPYSPTEGLVQLDDDHYRFYLRFTAAANQWNGTLSDAAAIYTKFFGQIGMQAIVQDNQDMTEYVGAVGAFPDATIQALFLEGYLDLKPEGVGVSYIVPSVPKTPFFGLDDNTSTVGGLDVGSWATFPAPRTPYEFGFDFGANVGGLDVGVIQP
jgi:hypothetical protein